VASGALAGLRRQLNRQMTMPAAVALSAVAAEPLWRGPVGLPSWAATACTASTVACSLLAARFGTGRLVDSLVQQHLTSASTAHKEQERLAERLRNERAARERFAAQHAAQLQQAQGELESQRQRQNNYLAELGRWAETVVTEMAALRAALTDGASVGPGNEHSSPGTARDPLEAVHTTLQLLGATVREAQSLALARGEQAALLTLGRRLESVLARAVEGFETVEKHTDDPEQLTRLWGIDALVTRGLRFARSSAALGGARGYRNLKPMDLSTVLTHAVAEVTRHEQVQLPSEVPQVLHGNAAHDLVHITAELLDNATMFSPPGAPVEVHVSVVNSGVAIEINDRGTGLGATERDRWNRLLAEPDERQRSASLKEQRLGLCVVAVLAAHRKVRVQLQENILGSTRAVIIVPQHLLYTAVPEEAPLQSGLPDTAGSGSAARGPEAARPRTVHGNEPLPAAAEDPHPAALAVARPAALPVTASPERPGHAVTASGLPSRRRGTSYMPPELKRDAAPPPADDTPRAASPGAALSAAQRGRRRAEDVLATPRTRHPRKGERS
jgi:signal transduction histidine kinase